jgi:hypothetical protein
MPFKVVHVFSQNAQGFNEVYYNNAGSINDVGLIYSTSFITAALALKHPDCFWTKVRISDVANLRSTLIININRSGNGGTSTDTPDVTGTAAVVTLVSTTPAAVRQLWLRGLPDGYVIRLEDGTDAPPWVFTNAIRVWTLALAAANFSVRSLNKVGASPNNYTTIASVSGTPGMGQATLTFPNGSYVPQSTARILISQVSPKILPGFNGHWSTSNLVTGSSTTTMNIPYNMPQAGPLNLIRGRFRPEVYNYGVINPTFGGFNFFRGRKTGRSPLVSRGRRTSVRLRSL